MLLSLNPECSATSLDTTSTTGFGTDGIPSLVSGSISSVVTEAKQGDNITTTGINRAKYGRLPQN